MLAETSKLFCVDCQTAANIAKTRIVWINEFRFVPVALRVCAIILRLYIVTGIQLSPTLLTKQ